MGRGVRMPPWGACLWLQAGHMGACTGCSAALGCVYFEMSFPVTPDVCHWAAVLVPKHKHVGSKWKVMAAAGAGCCLSAA